MSGIRTELKSAVSGLSGRWLPPLAGVTRDHQGPGQARKHFFAFFPFFFCHVKELGGNNISASDGQ